MSHDDGSRVIIVPMYMIKNVCEADFAEIGRETGMADVEIVKHVLGKNMTGDFGQAFSTARWLLRDNSGELDVSSADVHALMDGLSSVQENIRGVIASIHNCTFSHLGLMRTIADESLVLRVR